MKKKLENNYQGNTHASSKNVIKNLKFGKT